MNWYIQAKNDFLPEDVFGDDWEKIKRRKIIKKDEPYYDTITLTLYRGFDADLNNLKQINGQYVLSPKKSEQGVLWFSQSRNVASGRGKYILEYPLEGVKKYKQKIYYDDGSTYEIIPQGILEGCRPTENCKFWAEYELPDGWLFSYKTEKHIICTKDILVSSSMIRKEEDYEDER